MPLVREAGHALQFFPLRVLAATLQALPAPLLERLCLACGDLGRLVATRHTRIARRNLASAFPAASEVEREAILRATFRSFALTARDAVLVQRHAAGRHQPEVFEIPDVQTLRQLAADGRGCLLVTGHLGGWEMAGTLLARKFDISAVSRPYRNPWIRRSLERFRARFGQQVIYTDAGFRPLLAALRRGGFLAILPDKRLKTSRVPVRFFGRYVRVPEGPALLSLRTGAPILAAGCIRLGNRFRFRIELGGIVRPDRAAEPGVELQRLSQAYMTGLEEIIRRHPEQWIWFHDRWKKSWVSEDLDRDAGEAPPGASARTASRPGDIEPCSRAE